MITPTSPNSPAIGICPCASCKLARLPPGPAQVLLQSAVELLSAQPAPRAATGPARV